MENSQVPGQEFNTLGTPHLVCIVSESEELSSSRKARSETPARSDRGYESTGSSSFDVDIDAMADQITNNLGEFALSQSSDDVPRRPLSADSEQKAHPYGNGGHEVLEDSQGEKSEQKMSTTCQTNKVVLLSQSRDIEQDLHTSYHDEGSPEGSQYMDAEEEFHDIHPSNGLPQNSQPADLEESYDPFRSEDFYQDSQQGGLENFYDYIQTGIPTQDSQSADFDQNHNFIHSSRPDEFDQESSNSSQNHAYLQASQPPSQSSGFYDSAAPHSRGMVIEDSLYESSQTQDSPIPEGPVPECDNSQIVHPHISANGEHINRNDEANSYLLAEPLGNVADEHAIKMEISSLPHISTNNEEINQGKGVNDHLLNEALGNAADEDPIKVEVSSPPHIPSCDEAATQQTWPSRFGGSNHDSAMNSYGDSFSHQVDSGIKGFDKSTTLEKSDDAVIARLLSEQLQKNNTPLPDTGAEDTALVSRHINPQAIAHSRISGAEFLSHEQHPESFSSNESLHTITRETSSNLRTSKETATTADTEDTLQKNGVANLEIEAMDEVAAQGKGDLDYHAPQTNRDTTSDEAVSTVEDESDLYQNGFAHPETEIMHEEIPAPENADLDSQSLPMNEVKPRNEIANQIVSTPENTRTTTEASQTEHVPDNIEAAAGISDHASMNNSSVQLQGVSINCSQPENDEIDQISLEPRLPNSQVHATDQKKASMKEDSASLRSFDHNTISKLSSPKPKFGASQPVGDSASKLEIEQVAPVLTPPKKKSTGNKAHVGTSQRNPETIETFPPAPKKTNNKSSKAKSKANSDPSSTKASKNSTLIDLSIDEKEKTEDPNTTRASQKEPSKIGLKTNKTKTEPDVPASTNTAKVYNLDDDNDDDDDQSKNNNNRVPPSKNTKKKEAAIDLTQPDHIEMSSVVKRGRGRPKSGPKELGHTKESNRATLVKEESGTESRSLSKLLQKSREGGKRNADKLEVEQVSGKRQKPNPVKTEDAEFVASKPTSKNQEPVLAGVNTRSVQRSTTPVVVLSSQQYINRETIHIDDDDNISVTTESTQSNSTAKPSALKRKAKQLPVNTSQKRQSSLAVELLPGPPPKKAKVESQAKTTGRGKKTALSVVVENTKQLEAPTMSIERKEKPRVVLRSLSDATPEFPRFSIGDVYISLSVRDKSRSYCLHSEVLARLSPWFKKQLQEAVVEPSEDLRHTFPTLTARFELMVDPDTNEPVLKKVPFTMYLDRVAVGKPLPTFSDDGDSQVSLRGGIILDDGSSEVSPRSMSPREKGLRNLEIHNEINDSVEQAEENIKERFYEAYDNLFRAYYSLPLSVDSRQLHTALEQIEAALNLSEKYESLPVVRPHLTMHLFNFQRDLCKAIVREPPRWFWLAMRLNSALIYKEAMLHVVGNYPKWLEETILLVRDHPYDVEPLISMKVKKFREFKAAVDHDLSRSSISINHKPLAILDIANEKSYHTWLVIQCWQDWYNRAVIETKRVFGNATSSEMYQLMLEGGDAYLALETVLDTIGRLRGRKLTDAEVEDVEDDLARMKEYAQDRVKELCLNNSMVVAADEDITHFTCLKVSDDELPWPAPDFNTAFA